METDTGRGEGEAGSQCADGCTLWVTDFFSQGPQIQRLALDAFFFPGGHHFHMVRLKKTFSNSFTSTFLFLTTRINSQLNFKFPKSR